MIEEIKINGVLYKLVENTEKGVYVCNICGLDEICTQYPDFSNLCCDKNNINSYYKKQ